MKTHTVYATVFLILVVSFVSFDLSGGVTGSYLTDSQRESWGQYGFRDGPSRSHVGSGVFEKGELVVLGSDYRNYYSIYEGDFPSFGELSESQLKLCLGRVLKTNNCVSYEVAERNANSEGVREDCSPVSGMDINNDGKICRKDLDYYDALAKGLGSTGAVWNGHSSNIPCSQIGKEVYLELYGGWHVCQETPLGSPLKSNGVLVLQN